MIPPLFADLPAVPALEAPAVPDMLREPPKESPRRTGRAAPSFDEAEAGMRPLPEPQASMPSGIAPAPGAPVRDSDTYEIENDHIAAHLQKFKNVPQASYQFYRRSPTAVGVNQIHGFQGSVPAASIANYEDLYEWIRSHFGGNVWEVRTSAPTETGRIGIVKRGGFSLTVDAPPIVHALKPQNGAGGPEAGGFKALEKAAELNAQTVRMAIDNATGVGSDKTLVDILRDELGATRDQLQALRVETEKRIERATTEGGPSTRLAEVSINSAAQTIQQVQASAATSVQNLTTQFNSEKREVESRYERRIDSMADDMRKLTEMHRRDMDHLLNEHRTEIRDLRESLLRDKDNESKRLETLLSMEKSNAENYRLTTDRAIEARVDVTRAPLEARIETMKGEQASLQRRYEKLEDENRDLRAKQYNEALAKGNTLAELEKSERMARMMGMRRPDDEGGGGAMNGGGIVESIDKITRNPALGRIVEKVGDAFGARIQPQPMGTPIGAPIVLPVDIYGQPIFGSPSIAGTVPPRGGPQAQQHQHTAPPPTTVPPVVHTHRTETRTRPTPVVNVQRQAAEEAAPSVAPTPASPAAPAPAPTADEIRGMVGSLEEWMNLGVPMNLLAAQIVTRFDGEKLDQLLGVGPDAYQQQIESLVPGTLLGTQRGLLWLTELFAAIGAARAAPS